MDYPFKAYGRITYDANRGSLKSRLGWWMTIELEDEELSRYYRWWVNRVWWQADSHSLKRNYHRPPHWPHISIIRGEEPQRNKHLWGKYRAGERVKFRYSNVVYQTQNSFYAKRPDLFWYIHVDWEDYVTCRRKFGLTWKRPDGHPFRGHITVARTYD